MVNKRELELSHEYLTQKFIKDRDNIVRDLKEIGWADSALENLCLNIAHLLVLHGRIRQVEFFLNIPGD